MSEFVTRKEFAEMVQAERDRYFQRQREENKRLRQSLAETSVEKPSPAPPPPVEEEFDELNPDHIYGIGPTDQESEVGRVRRRVPNPERFPMPLNPDESMCFL